MRLAIEAKKIEIDALLSEWIRTTLLFAAWNFDVGVENISIRLDREPDEESVFRYDCGVVAHTEIGPVAAEGTGSDVWAAVQDAADRLEVDLYRRHSRDRYAFAEDLAA